MRRWTAVLTMICGSIFRGGQDGTAKAAHDNVPLKTYADAAYGVSFRYPVVWKQVPQFDQYCQPSAFNDKLKAKVIVQFTGAGNYYQKTFLDSLYFQYGRVKMASAAACLKVADDAQGEGDPKSADMTIGGVRFRHGKGGACGLSHGIDADVYTTFRDGVCFVFEEDFTTCSGRDDTRNLTKKEMEALERHLDDIQFSVLFHKRAAK